MSSPNQIRRINHTGKTTDFLVFSKDGRWAEIIRDSKSCSKPLRTFSTSEEWKNLFPVGSTFRETTYQTFRQKAAIPLDPTLSNLKFLNAVVTKFKIRASSIEERESLEDDIRMMMADSYRMRANLVLENPHVDPYKDTEAQRMLAMANHLDKQNTLEFKKMNKYEPLTRSSTIAYVMGRNELLPLGANLEKGLIFFEGKVGKSFPDVDLPSRPELWVKKQNRLLRVL